MFSYFINTDPEFYWLFKKTGFELVLIDNFNLTANTFLKMIYLH